MSAEKHRLKIAQGTVRNTMRTNEKPTLSLGSQLGTLKQLQAIAMEQSPNREVF